MRAIRLAAAAFLFGGLFPLGVAAPAACAAEGPHAVLVVDTEMPGGQHRYCVSMPDGSVSGLELIELASEQHGLQYRFGYGGNVVCQLAGVGYASDDCLTDGPEFWGYWRGDGSGGWDWSSSGGHATIVRDGDVEGWSWGTGNDGSSHPVPPPTTFASVCGRAPSGGGDGSKDDDGKRGKDTTPSDPSKGSSGKETDASASDSPIADQAEAAAKVRGSKGPGGGKPGDRSKGPSERGRKSGRNGSPGREVGPSESGAAAPGSATQPASAEGPEDGGVPIGGFVAAGAAFVCLVGGVFLQRRRSRAR